MSAGQLDVGTRTSEIREPWVLSCGLTLGLTTCWDCSEWDTKLSDVSFAKWNLQVNAEFKWWTITVYKFFRDMWSKIVIQGEKSYYWQMTYRCNLTFYATKYIVKLQFSKLLTCNQLLKVPDVLSSKDQSTIKDIHIFKMRSSCFPEIPETQWPEWVSNLFIWGILILTPIK